MTTSATDTASPCLLRGRGQTWRWTSHLERDVNRPRSATRPAHYPTIIQAADGTLHASYSYPTFEKNTERDPQGQQMAQNHQARPFQ